MQQYFSNRSGDGSHLTAPQEALQCIDIVLRSAPAVSCIGVGRSFFTPPPQIIDLGDGMEMYYGFYQSAVLCWKPFLNVDVAHKAFPIKQPVVELIRELSKGRADLRQGLDNYLMEDVQKFLRTLKVQYEIPHHPASRRIYRVNGEF